jgi:hypothetical protein
MAGSKKTALKKPKGFDPIERAMELCDEMSGYYTQKEEAEANRKACSEELEAIAETYPELFGENKSFKHSGIEVRFASKQVATIEDETKFNPAALAARYPLMFPVGMSNSKIEKAFENEETRTVLRSFGIGLEKSEKITVGKAK